MKCPHCNGTGEIGAGDIHVGHLILERRKFAGLTQEELGRLVGISRAQIANVESGRTETSIKALRRFADALNCSMKDLVP